MMSGNTQTCLLHAKQQVDLWENSYDLANRQPFNPYLSDSYMGSLEALQCLQKA